MIDTKGGWIAQHGGYEKLEDGTYKITKGDYAGHTMKYTGEKGVFHVFDKYGNCIGQWTSKNGGEKVASPIGLDLNGSGRIETTGQTTAKDGQRTAVGETVDFDIDADGQMDKVEWFAGNGDGILVDTAKIGANGNIDGSALFGDEGGKFANGYDKLAARDANGDGRISGDEMNGLAVWVDDGDAVLEAGELQTLAAHDIKSINATMNMDAEGRMISSATRGDGSSVYTEDVWFAQQA